MRIVQFSDSYRPVVNGVATAVDLLAQGLRRQHEVTIVAPRHPKQTEAPHVVRYPGYIVPTQRDYPLAFPFSRRTDARLREEGFDLVHTHTPFALGVAGRRLARRLNVPLVGTYHTLYVEYAHYARPAPRGLTRWYLTGVSRKYCQASDVVVVPTEPIAEVLRGYGVTRPIHVIPSGVDIELPQNVDRAAVRAKYGLPPDTLMVLYAGRVAQEKNLELLLDAFARVVEQCPTAHLVLAGDGPTLPDLKVRAQRLGITDRVAFTGFLGHDELLPLYVAADVKAFASLTDTQGLVLVEAKVAGLPAVSVDAYGPSTIVRHEVDGLLCPNDAAAFAAALLRLLTDDELRRRMADAARADAARFTVAGTVRRYEAAYAEAFERFAERSPSGLAAAAPRVD